MAKLTYGELKNKAEQADASLISTIFREQRIPNPRWKDGIFPGFSSSKWVVDLMAYPELIQLAIDSFVASVTTTEPTEEEINNLKATDYMYNDTPDILKHLGIYEQTQQAVIARTETLARLQVEKWAQLTDPGQWIDFNAPRIALLGQFVKEGRRWDNDTYGAASKLIETDPVLRHLLIDKITTNLKTHFLQIDLVPVEIAKNSQKQRAEKYAYLTNDSNSIGVFANVLKHLGIFEEARQAYNTRFVAALKLNPHNTTEQLDEWTWERTKPQSYKDADALRKNWQFITGGMPKNTVNRIRSVDTRKRLENRERKGFGGNDSTELFELQVTYTDNTQATLYAVETGYFSPPDDADDWTNLFTSKAAARGCYHQYLNPMDNPKSKDTFTALITLPDGSQKRLTGCTLVENTYLFQHNRPSFYKAACEPLGITQTEVDQVMQESLDEHGDARLIMISDRYRAGLLKMGTNLGGYTVIDADQAEINRQLNSKDLSVTQYNCWETGINYYKLASRLPEAIFSKLKQAKVIWYHSEEIEEEGTWTGWCSTDRKTLAEQLDSFGWHLTVNAD